MAANMYRVGDYVLFEISSTTPYQIRRIEELNKNPNGNVEAKVMCFYRRRDISSNLLRLADKHQDESQKPGVPEEETDKSIIAATTSDDSQKPAAAATLENGVTSADESSLSSEEHNGESGRVEKVEKMDTTEAPATPQPTVDSNVKVNGITNGTGGPTVGLLGMELLEPSQRHQLKHRELFLSRQIETLPATHIRGKCSVTLLNETETPDNYLSKDDVFFYSLVYDPQQKTLLADKGEIRVGDKYQAMITDMITEDEQKTYRQEPLETLVFHPYHNLTDRQIDQFLIVARAVGTFSRALDSSSSVKQPSLHMSAAAASRDITLFHSMALLHQAGYDLGKAVCFLVPPPSKQHYPLEADKTTGHNTTSLGGPVLCRDQMEEWSAAEANLFEEALEKYGKDFNDIRHDFLPWKGLRDIVEYYYMWKTTDRYVQQKRVKAVEAESRLKQVYIPNYVKPNPAAVAPGKVTGELIPSTKPCESCSCTASVQWYSWGPPQCQYRLCQDCWTYWKKYGGLKRTHKHDTYDKKIGDKPEETTAAVGITGMAGTNIDDRFNSRHRQVQQQQQQQQLLKCNVPGCDKEFRIRSVLSRHYMEDHGIALPWDQHGMGGRVPPKTRAAFFLHTTLLTRIARRLAPKQLLNPRKAARNPFNPINMLAIKQNCQSKPADDIRAVGKIIAKRFKSVNQVVDRMLSHASSATRPMAIVNPMGQPAGRVSTIHHKPQAQQNNNNLTQSPQVRKRPHNGVVDSNGPLAKRPLVKGSPQHNNVVVLPAAAAKRHFLGWMETAEDCYFQGNSNTKTLRRKVTGEQLKKLARSPCKHNATVSKHMPPMPKTAANPRIGPPQPHNSTVMLS